MYNRRIPYCNISVPDYKFCYVENVNRGGYCTYPFLDVFVYMLNASDDTLVMRNQAFRENFKEYIYRNASRHGSGKEKYKIPMYM